MNTTYLPDVQHAMQAVDKAIAHAVTFLPDDVLQRHWQAEQRGEPDPWLTVSFWYETLETGDPEISTLLSHLALLHKAIRCLSLVLVLPPDHPPDLSLPKTRKPSVA